MMTERRPGERPPHVKAPAHLSLSPPVPVPRAAEDKRDALDPTRYGDWERKGVAIDF